MDPSQKGIPRRASRKDTSVPPKKRSQKTTIVNTISQKKWKPLVIISLILACIVIASVIVAVVHTRSTNNQDLVFITGNTETDHPPPPVYATSAYLLDANTGKTLYRQNPTMRLPILSTTKIMTAIIAVERGKLSQKITINDTIASDLANHLSSDSSLFGIKKGETYTLEELLYGLLLPSGNDAAIAIADGVAGNYYQFISLMNQRAGELGLHDTHYVNPHGLLDTNHFSSAYDLALLEKHAMYIPEIAKIMGTRNYSFSATPEHAAHTTFNGNQFLWWYPGANGGKIGYGYNDAEKSNDFVQVVSVTRNGRQLIGVVMHTINWWTDMRHLMNWGFDDYQWVSPKIDAQKQFIPYASSWNYFATDTPENATITVGSETYYGYTGYSVEEPILDFFASSGGLHTFGFPTNNPKADGSTTTQEFQRSTITCVMNKCRTKN